MTEINELYLELLKKIILSDLHHFQLREIKIDRERNLLKRYFKRYLIRYLEKDSSTLIIKTLFTEKQLETGKVRPSLGYSMIGKKRLNNVQELIDQIYRQNILGDFIEAGVWRGGVLMFMRACMKIHRDRRRIVWGADSFKGLPESNPERYPDDQIFRELFKDNPDHGLMVSKEEVIANMAKLGLFDEQVRLLEGWFSETLYSDEIGELSLCRIDGDLYQSTYEALDALYPKISLGGFVIVDDYGLSSGAAKRAVDDYRVKHKITSPIKAIDWSGIYWQQTD